MHEFNKLVRNRKATLLKFPGASSRQLLHYMDVHLEGNKVDIFMFPHHVAVNDLLNAWNYNKNRNNM